MSFIEDPNFGAMQPEHEKTAEKIELTSEELKTIEGSGTPSKASEKRIAAIAEELKNNPDKITEITAKLYNEKFYDQRGVFKGKNTPNKDFIKEKIRELINEKNNNFCRISIDVEGLKTINDIVDKEKGDIYLSEVYAAAERAVAAIKQQIRDNQMDPDELEFKVSAEGGDEFGILIVGKEKSPINLETTQITMSKNEQELPIPQVLSYYFNDELNEIDYTKFITNEDIIKKNESEIVKNLEKDQNLIKDATNINDELIKEIIDKYSSEIKEKFGENPPTKLDTEFQNFLKELIIKKSHQKIEKIKDEFKDYKFFASASAGYLNMGSNWAKENADEIKNKTQEVINKNRTAHEKNPDTTKLLTEKEAEEIALLSVFFSVADEKMKENKDNFKADLRRSGAVDKTIFQNLFTHLKLLARNDDMKKLEEENQKVKNESEEKDKIIEEQGKELKEALEKIKQLEEELSQKQ